MPCARRLPRRPGTWRDAFRCQHNSGMDLDLLNRTLTELGEPAFRARQIWRWAADGAESFDSMTDVPKRLRHTLADAVPFSTLTLEHEAHARDGTVKVLFSTADGR